MIITLFKCRRLVNVINLNCVYESIRQFVIRDTSKSCKIPDADLKGEYPILFRVNQSENNNIF